MASWLARQRKADLIELADVVGFKNHDGLRKTELETELDEYLSGHSARWAHEPRLASYFATRARVNSPIKAEPPLLMTRRRTIRNLHADHSRDNEEEEEAPPSAGSASILVRTPGQALPLVRRISRPAAPPADVAPAVDRNAVAIRNAVAVHQRVVSMYEESRIVEARQVARECLSTVRSVLLIVALFELLYLGSEALHGFMVPPAPRLDQSSEEEHSVYLLYLSRLLSRDFWSPALAWTFTSFLLPALFGYFFNLSAASKPSSSGRGRRSAAAYYAIDPLTFSIAKAIATYVVYAQGATFYGLLDPSSISRINGALYSGWRGVLVGCAITGLMSVYDAVLRK